MEDIYALLQSRNRTPENNMINTETDIFNDICKTLIEKVIKPAVISKNPGWFEACCWSFSKRSKRGKGVNVIEPHTERLKLAKYFKKKDFDTEETALKAIKSFLVNQAEKYGHKLDKSIKLPFINIEHQKKTELQTITKESAQMILKRVQNVSAQFTTVSTNTKNDFLWRIISLENRVNVLEAQETERKSNDCITSQRLESLEKWKESVESTLSTILRRPSEIMRRSDTSTIPPQRNGRTESNYIHSRAS